MATAIKRVLIDKKLLHINFKFVICAKAFTILLSQLKLKFTHSTLVSLFVVGSFGDFINLREDTDNNKLVIYLLAASKIKL